MTETTVRLPNGTDLKGTAPIVIIGPNGSGKTRQARTITAAGSTIGYINALRNTRVAPQLQMMSPADARNQIVNHRNQARANHWEIVSDFDVMLSELIAADASVAMEYYRSARSERAYADPPKTVLGAIEDLWRTVFPGRELEWKDWAPTVKSSVTDSIVVYSGNFMSDGEKAGLYLAGKVLSADPGVLIIDEPETHMHSLLAVRLWDALEVARPDIRFVYITHDLTFALSRTKPIFVLASPTEGLRTLDISESVAEDVTEILLGSASLSFYASRIVFCEGGSSSLDQGLYDAWFRQRDTVVRPVGSCEMVMRCVGAMRESQIAAALEAIGLIDRDYYPDAFLSNLPDGVSALKVHEVESLYCLPEVVQAVASHVGKVFDLDVYLKKLTSTVSNNQRHRIVVERWKRHLRPQLESLVSSVTLKAEGLEEISDTISEIFDYRRWKFSPEKILREEKGRVESAIPGGTIEDVLQLVPGKQLRGIAAQQVGLTIDSYVNLIVSALRGDNPKLAELSAALETALASHLPPRAANM